MLFGISNLPFHESIKIKIYIFLFLPFLYGSILWILKIKITLKYYKYVSSHCRGERINNTHKSSDLCDEHKYREHYVPSRPRNPMATPGVTTTMTTMVYDERTDEEEGFGRGGFEGSTLRFRFIVQ